MLLICHPKGAENIIMQALTHKSRGSSISLETRLRAGRPRLNSLLFATASRPFWAPPSYQW